MSRSPLLGHVTTLLVIGAVIASGCRSGFDVMLTPDDAPPCRDGACPDETWYALGDSALGLWSERIGGSSWGGGISNNAGVSRLPSMALDSSGHPVVAWEDDSSGNFEIYVRRFDGSIWGEVGAGSASGGGISNNAGKSYGVKLALDASDRPVVVWYDFTSGSYEIYIKRFDGTAWIEVGAGSASGGGISNNPDWSLDPTLALDSAGNPVLAWVDHQFGHNEIYVKRFDGSAWVEVGSGSATGGGISNAPLSNMASLALDAAERPVVAWSAEDGIYVKRFDGMAWVEVGVGSASGGGISNSAVDSWYPTLVLDAAGNPVVAWVDVWLDGSGNVVSYVRRFNGASWVDVGEGTAIGAWHLDLALDPAGNPVVTWSDDTSGDWEIYLRRFDGVDWTDIGTLSAGGTSPTLALDASGNPVVAWTSYASGNGEVYIQRFDDSTWRDMVAAPPTTGGISNTVGTSSNSSLAMDAAGNPTVAWSDASSGDWQIDVKRFDGSAWLDLSVGSFSLGGQSPSLAIDATGHSAVAWEQTATARLVRLDGATWVPDSPSFGGNVYTPVLGVDDANRLVVAASGYRDAVNYDIYVTRLDGGAWAEVGIGSASGGGISDNVGSSKFPTLAVDSSGHPLVAWQDDASGNEEIYIKRFDGSTWQEIATGSASGVGISDNVGSSAFPTLAVDSSGHPLVAWQDNASGNDEIYIKRFDGFAWQEIATGSALGGGISDNAGSSKKPTLAVDSSDLPLVAWQDDTSGNDEVYVRRFDGLSWREIAGSASAGGVSNSGGSSVHPRLGVAAGRACVAWTEGGSTSTEIVMRCTDL